MSSPAQSSAAIERPSLRSLAPLWEILVAYALIEGALWSLGPARYWWSLAATVWIIGVTIYRKPPLRDLGMSTHGLWQSLWITGLAFVFTGICVAVATWAGTLHDYSPGGVQLRATGYLIWCLEQEFILQSFMFLRLESLVGGSRAVVLSALLFALAHLPSPVLTVGSLAMAWIFCSAFRRYRNIYPLAVAHWLMGFSLSLALPDFVARHMRVGIGYIRFIAH
jgi:membrane protease YdiL (CAAX protease family)